MLALLFLVAVIAMALSGAASWRTALAADVSPAEPDTKPADPEFRVLCYHDIRDNLRESFLEWPESTAVETSELIRHLTWLDENGYHPVSMQQIVDARAGRGRLPDKAVLLTFDDGFKSAYTKVFPLLKQFKFPAVISLVGEWMETPDGTNVLYGSRPVARNQFLSWQEVREMVDSGLVEVASHSHNLHKGLLGNPQGNEIPAAIVREYDPEKAAYEDDSRYAKRVRKDLDDSSNLIARRTGVRPRVMVWPFGAYSLDTNKWAAEVGMPVTMNLEPGPNPADLPLSRMRRTLVSYTDGVTDLIGLLRQPATYGGSLIPRERVVHVDLDYVYDKDTQKQEANLSTLIDRIVKLRPTTVYLQAYADPKGDGTVESVYFPNRHMPMRADLFSRAAWQLRSRAGVRVYAWMPVMAFKLPAENPAAAHVVQTMPGAPKKASEMRYHRLSPFDPLARKMINDIYEDLGKHAFFTGVLFHDDATLSDYEDASPQALRYYHEQWNLPDSLEAIRADPSAFERWSKEKTRFLNQFTVDLANTLRRYQPALLTARNLYAEPVLNPESEAWYAQSLPSFLEIYDFTAVMAMPYMERADEPTQWLARLIGQVAAIPDALPKTVFELQSRDWRTGEPVPTKTLAAQLRQLRVAGARNFGYYPDDFHNNEPDLATIMPEMSTRTAPDR